MVGRHRRTPVVSTGGGAQMRRRITIGLVVVGLVAAVAVTTAASGRQGSATITIHARSQLERVNFVDNDPKGSSAADLLVFTERLVDARGRQIRSDAATCTTFRRPLALHRNLHPARGPDHGPARSAWPDRHLHKAITGGTGRLPEPLGPLLSINVRARGTVSPSASASQGGRPSRGRICSSRLGLWILDARCRRDKSSVSRSLRGNTQAAHSTSVLPCGSSASPMPMLGWYSGCPRPGASGRRR